MLFIQNLTYRVGGRALFENASVSIPTGHRVGLVGPNGAGKTTLFRLISGELSLDGGDISLLKGAQMGMVRQDLPDDDTSLIDIVLSADAERSALLAEAEHTQDAERIGYIYSRLEEIRAYDAPARAATILAGLGFNEQAQQSPIRAFSGGWRARVALAAALFKEPNLLLLDEPTNHLDFEAMVWLEQFLAKYPHTLLIISHDRDMLNKTVNHIVHLEQQKLTLYSGNYDFFERKRAEQRLGQQALHERQVAQKAHMMAFVERFRAKASKARQAQSRLKMIEKMDIVDAVMAERVTRFSFPDPGEEKSPLMVLEQVDAGYDPARPVLKNLNLRIDADDRIALLGANGNGKSTLMKIIAGRLAPLQGQTHKSGKLRVGYFAQFQTDELEVGQTPYQILQRTMPQAAEPKVRAALAEFGFDKTRADTKVGALSGGEKARLLFCLMSRDAPHIMLLDEPTNHLDMDAREALLQALNAYQGAVILVSHDPHLTERVADRLWIVADGSCKPYDDDLDAYRELVMRQRKREREQEKQEARNRRKTADEPAPAAPKPASTQVQKEAKRLEAQLERVQAKKAELEAEMAALAGAAEPKRYAELAAQHATLEAEAQKLETAWLAVADSL
jgi:ATP-binding cassette subfamily F protein 3